MQNSAHILPDYEALRGLAAYVASQTPSLAGPQLAAASIRQAIVNGVLPGGAAIKQDLVAEAFGLSKIPVREALRELEVERLVTFVRNRGFVVAPESLVELRESFELRSVLEPLALRHAIPLLSASDFDAAQLVLLRQQRDRAVEHLQILNLRFHMALYRPCGRPHLLALIEQAHSISHRYSVRTLRFRRLPAPDIDEHRAILEACEARDTEQATGLLVEHIMTAADRVARSYSDLTAHRERN